jgi:ABC-type multidrug transport system permease subunit
MLDVTLVARAPTSALILGRAAAFTMLGLAVGLFGVVVVAVFTGEAPPASDLPLLIASLAICGFALFALGVLMSPITALLGGRSGFFAGIMPALFFVSGIAFPVARLPDALEAVAHALPTVWAMEAVVAAAQGDTSSAVVVDLGASLLLSCLTLLIAVAGVMFVEKRVRVTGELGRY